jgi:hypothetical protein
MSEPVRLVHVLDAEPGVDEDQPVIALEEEAVKAGDSDPPPAEQSPVKRTQRSTVEMMNSQNVRSSDRLDCLSLSQHGHRGLPLRAGAGLHNEQQLDGTHQFLRNSSGGRCESPHISHLSSTEL